MKAFLARAARHVGFQIGAVLLLLFVGTALLSVFWTPHPVDALQMRAKLMPSSAAYPLGTDHIGRDVCSAEAQVLSGFPVIHFHAHRVLGGIHVRVANLHRVGVGHSGPEEVSQSG